MFKSAKNKYIEDVIPKREEMFGVKNINQTPKIEKVVLNSRVKQGGQIGEDKILSTIERISGQKPNATKARKSISNFKIREGMAVGAKATLRGKRAWDFLDRMVNITLPRVRDFSGLNRKSFDGKGNYTIGFSEHNAFPESAGDDIAHLHGIEVVIVTTAKDDKSGLTLLSALGFPFKKE